MVKNYLKKTILTKKYNYVLFYSIKYLGFSLLKGLSLIKIKYLIKIQFFHNIKKMKFLL